jgi:hypothetical protein
MAWEISSSLQIPTVITPEGYTAYTGQTITLTDEIPTIIDRDGGDQIIITITQEVFRRKFNSGFQNG